MSSKIRVVIVDDSAVVRSVIAQALSQDPAIEVVGQAEDAYRARDLIVQLKPDVVTLDIDMPRMDGISFLKRLMAKLPTPVIILTSTTRNYDALRQEALNAGAVDFVRTPKMAADASAIDDLRRAVRAASSKRTGRSLLVSQQGGASRSFQPPKSRELDVIAIGASTGGVEALSHILPKFPATAPGIVVVIHMPAAYTSEFAERLNRACAMKCKLAESRDRVKPGTILLAPGGSEHLNVERFGSFHQVRFVPAAPGEPFVPSVDELFQSVATAAGPNAVGVLMTGMGEDGAKGMLALRKSGARCFAQDQRSSVVFGMPKAALENGSAEIAVHLDNIPKTVLKAFQADFRTG